MTAQDLDADTFTRCYGGLCKRLQRLSRTGANRPGCQERGTLLRGFKTHHVPSEILMSKCWIWDSNVILLKGVYHGKNRTHDFT